MRLDGGLHKCITVFITIIYVSVTSTSHNNEESMCDISEREPKGGPCSTCDISESSLLSPSLVLPHVKDTSECPAYTYGEECAERCGHCYRGQPCDRATGECGTCSSGWMGLMCDKPCSHKKFGMNCSRTCNCYTTFTCDPVSGDCGSHGCSLGWKGDRCDIKSDCNGGFYGKDCIECGSCLTDCPVWNPTCRPNCDRKTGSCPTGCKRNFVGERCDVCYGRYYGRRCDKICGHCYNGYLCHMVTGICGHTGCEPGYLGSKCDLECREGRYGYLCAYNCSGHCRYGDMCDFRDGSCMTGCQKRWTGPKCDTHQSCLDNTHGGNYTLCPHLEPDMCGNCVNGEACNNVTNMCDNGCVGRFIAPQCKVCQRGWYGHACTETCGHCKKSTICNDFTGACVDGCATDFTGAFCSIRKLTLNDFLHTFHG